MRAAVVLAVLSVGAAVGADGDARLKVLPAKGLPAVEAVTVYRTANGKSEQVAEVTAPERATVLPADGPFEVWVRCKGGVAVKLPGAVAVKAGATHELNIGDVLGAVEVFGDDLPRAEKVVLTAVRDPGPGEKGHVAVQVATEYRVGMCAPPGEYAVWVVPANGARAQRVAESVRVRAGRTERVGD